MRGLRSNFKLKTNMHPPETGFDPETENRSQFSFEMDPFDLISLPPLADLVDPPPLKEELEDDCRFLSDITKELFPTTDLPMELQNVKWVNWNDHLLPELRYQLALAPVFLPMIFWNDLPDWFTSLANRIWWWSEHVSFGVVDESAGREILSELRTHNLTNLGDSFQRAFYFNTKQFE